MSPCDGSGIDKQYIDTSHLGISPAVVTPSSSTSRRVVDDDDDDDDNDSHSSMSGRRSVGWNMNSLMNNNKSCGLSAIEENSMSASDASLYSSAMSYSTNKSTSTALRSVGSVHSEQTIVMSNSRQHRNRTPTFGDKDDKENYPPHSDSAVLI
jgi:hypothetical protein